MSQSDSNTSLSLFSAFEQVKTTLEAMELAEQNNQMMLADQYASDVYEIMKASGGGVDKCVGFVKFAEAEAAEIDLEIDRLKELKKRREAAVKRIKQLALAYMDTVGVDKLEGSFGRRFTKVETKSVVITALDQIPDSLKRVTTVIEPNKKAIADYILEHGQCVGATLAMNTHVRVK